MKKILTIPTWERLISYSLVVHLLAAIFSTGFHHFDEHFQIYEFLNYKLGHIGSETLAWEFREQIRPWFQVWVYFCLYKASAILGITSPFTHALIFRLVTAVLGWLALLALWPLIQRWIKQEKNQLICFYLLHFCWFVPYIQARTSSESFGIIFYFFGLAAFFSKRERALHGLLAGLFFGLCYLSRFQLALMVAPLWIWALLLRERRFLMLATTALGVLFAIGLGFIFDQWGYGTWTFSLWHYFRTNFLGGIMSTVQQYPFWWYLRWSLLRGIPPLSLPLIVATLFGWIKFWRHPLFAMTLPLFLFHSWVGHKELRYIFPLIMLTPFYLVMMLEWISQRYPSLMQKKWIGMLAKCWLALNLIFVAVATLRPANPSVNFYRFLYERQDIKNIIAIDESPFSMLGLPISFYKRPELNVYVDKIENLRLKGEVFIFTRTGQELLEWSAGPHCKTIYSAYPKWLLNYNWGNWISRSRVWALHHCQL